MYDIWFSLKHKTILAPFKLANNHLFALKMTDLFDLSFELTILTS